MRARPRTVSSARLTVGGVGELAHADGGRLGDRHPQRHLVLDEADHEQIELDAGDLLRLDADDSADAMGRIDDVLAGLEFGSRRGLLHCHSSFNSIWGRRARRDGDVLRATAAFGAEAGLATAVAGLGAAAALRGRRSSRWRRFLRAFAGGAFAAALAGLPSAPASPSSPWPRWPTSAAFAATRLASGFRPLVSFFFSGFVLRIDPVPPRGTKRAPSNPREFTTKNSHRARIGSIGAGKR